MAASSSSTEEKIKRDVIDRRAATIRLDGFVKVKPHEAVCKQSSCVSINERRSIPVQSYQGQDKEATATLFYLPGTASIANCTEATEAHASQIAAILSCRVIVIHPRLVPENKHPLPYNDAVGVINQLIQHGNESIVNEDGTRYDFKSKPLAIAGYSSGGLLATQIYLNSLSEGISPFCQLLAIAPIVNIADLEKLDYESNQLHYKEIFERFPALYLPKGQTLSTEHNSPSHMNLSKLQLAGSAMTFVYGEKDPLKAQIVKFCQAVEPFGARVEKLVLTDFDHGLTWQTTKHLDEVSQRFKSLLPQMHVKEIIPLKKLTKSWKNEKETQKFNYQFLKPKLPSPLYKVQLFGETGVGKTTLIIKFSEGIFLEKLPAGPCRIFDYAKGSVVIDNNETIQLQVWDGRDPRRATMEAPSRGIDIAIFVFDVTNRASFLKLKAHISGVEWHRSPNVISTIVANKCDIAPIDWGVTKEEIDEFMQGFLNSEFNLVYASCKTNVNIDELFKICATQRYQIISNQESKPKQAITIDGEVSKKLNNTVTFN